MYKQSTTWWNNVVLFNHSSLHIYFLYPAICLYLHPSSFNWNLPVFHLFTSFLISNIMFLNMPKIIQMSFCVIFHNLFSGEERNSRRGNVLLALITLHNVKPGWGGLPFILGFKKKNIYFPALVPLWSFFEWNQTDFYSSFDFFFPDPILKQ